MVRTIHNPVTSFNYILFDGKYVKSFDINIDEFKDISINIRYIDKKSGEDQHQIYNLNQFIEIFEDNIEDYLFETLIKYELHVLLKIYYIIKNMNVNVSDKQKYQIQKLIKKIMTI